jgi:hypothetical protein
MRKKPGGYPCHPLVEVCTVDRGSGRDLLVCRVQRWMKSGGRKRLKSKIITSEAKSD